MDVKKLPQTCPEIARYIEDAEKELKALLSQEASMLGNIERLKLQLNDVRQGVAANRQSIAVARDAIAAYRQFLIAEDDENAEEKKV